MSKTKRTRSITEIHNDVRFLADGVDLMLEIVAGVARLDPSLEFPIAVDEKFFNDVVNTAKGLNDARSKTGGGKGDGGGICIPPKCDGTGTSIGVYVAALNALFQEIGINELRPMSQKLSDDGHFTVTISPSRRLVWEAAAPPVMSMSK